jgi:hypothetical protein
LHRESNYQQSSGKFLTKYENINDLIGSQENVDFFKQKFEEFIKVLNGTFTVEWKVQTQ